MARTVMIVDDVPFVRDTLRHILTENHFSVVAEAADGEEAIKKYAESKPLVVMMDIVMPKMTGIEATKRITKRHKDAKIVVVSAMGQENLIMDAINAGAKDYVVKPFTADEIIKTVEHVISSDGPVSQRASF